MSYRILQAILISITAIAGCLCLYAINLSNAATKENVTVQIVGAEWSGSGFILEDGIVITAAHVLHDLIEGRAILSDGTIIELDPNTYMIDGVWDIAVAKLHNYDGPCAVLGDDNSIIVGCGVEIVGYPLGLELWHSFGEVARLERAGNIDIDCDANPGNSGGPIFIGDEVVGVLTCGYNYTDISSGVAVSVVRNMVDRYKILKD